VAGLERDARAGVVAAGDLLRSAGDLATGDAALVVALAPAPDDPYWTVAWVGDCRACAWDGQRLYGLTSDHTVATAMRASGVAVSARLEHVLFTSVRTARPKEVGIARVAEPTSLVLVSDGVHRVVPAGRLAAIVGASTGYASPVDRAEWIVEAAEEAGTTDNATALVLDSGRGREAPRVPAQRAA
jgi:protein phosphatase